MARDPDDSTPSNPERREALQTIGRITVAGLVGAVASRVGVARAQAATDPAAVRRDRAHRQSVAALMAAARSAIGRGVDKWTASAQVTGGVINGSGVFLPPGSLYSQDPYAESVERALLDFGAPQDVAAAIGGLSWEVWAAWSKSYHLSLPRALPQFAAVPAPQAKDAPLEPVPLHKGSAPGNVGISAEVFGDALLQVLPKWAKDPIAVEAVEKFARQYMNAFSHWFKEAELGQLVGRGTVPTFAPPYVPVGPVVMGDVVGFGVLKAPPFFAER